jgi:sec-independent protein translocase protein TatA
MLLFIGGSEIIFIVFIVLLLFGTSGVANLARTVGKGMGEFKKVSDELKREIDQIKTDTDSTPEPQESKDPYPVEKSDAQEK